jgi:hypothetical protein
MAFRAGTQGPTLWPECRRLGVAAIQYDPLNDIDLSPGEAAVPNAVWSRLAPAQQRSVKRFAYEMRPGDVIYVKEGPRIVGRGVVAAPYRFVPASAIVEPRGVPWQHQRPVTWEPGVPEVAIQVGTSQQFVVQPLRPEDVARLERDLILAGWGGAFVSPDELPPGSPLVEGAATRVWVSGYERNPAVRAQCIATHGTNCSACGMGFGSVYGPVAAGYIHVHHLRPLSESGGSHVVDPVADLRPVCPNCHAVLHLGGQLRSIEEVRHFLAQQRHGEPGAAPDPKDM